MTGDVPTDNEAFAAAVFSGSVDPILVLSHDGVVLQANEAARRVFGREVAGTEFGIPAASASGAEVDLLTPNGARIAELRLGDAMLYGEPVYVANLRDVTDRKRVEQALRDFVSSASHEFRTPLFAIAGFAETLESQWEALPEGDRQRYIEIIHRQARRLSRLSDDLLTIARLDGDSIEVLPAVVLVDMIADRAMDLLADVEVVRDIDPTLSALVDPDHLEEMLINLVTNAGKYGGGEIKIQARGVDEFIEIKVSDQGPGVPTAFRDRLFERFSRERGSARKAPGTGLGLAIVLGLLERNAGTIGYEDTPGGGATFVLRLPAA